MATIEKSVKVFNSDIDLTLSKNIYGDVPKLINAAAVKNRLYNKLFIGADEIPFDDKERPDIRDLIHGEVDDLSKVLIADIISGTIGLDDNVNVRNVEIDTNDDKNGYTATSEIEILYDNAGSVVENLGFTVITQE
jgi:hypothetical protein